MSVNFKVWRRNWIFFNEFIFRHDSSTSLNNKNKSYRVHFVLLTADMIHVCRLDVGSRHVFDSADGINEVGSLVTAIEHYFNIDRQKQILLISGGEILADYTQKLYRLSAGRVSTRYIKKKKNTMNAAFFLLNLDNERCVIQIYVWLNITKT